MNETGIRLANGQTLKSCQVLEDPIRTRIMKLIADDVQRNHSVSEIQTEIGTPIEQVIDSIAHLEDLGLIELDPEPGPTGEPNGSAYRLTENGRMLVIDIKAEKLWMKRLGDLLDGR